METLDAVARRYGVRPSELVGEYEGPAAFTIDLWAHNFGVMREVREARRRNQHG